MPEAHSLTVHDPGAKVNPGPGPHFARLRRSCGTRSDKKSLILRVYPSNWRMDIDHSLFASEKKKEGLYLVKRSAIDPQVGVLMISAITFSPRKNALNSVSQAPSTCFVLSSKWIKIHFQAPHSDSHRTCPWGSVTEIPIEVRIDPTHSLVVDAIAFGFHIGSRKAVLTGGGDLTRALVDFLSERTTRKIKYSGELDKLSGGLMNNLTIS